MPLLTDTLNFLDLAALFQASKRVAALALVDASLAVPSSQFLCDKALKLLQLRTSDGSEFMYYRPSKKPSALVILCHPSEGISMCKTLADMWQKALEDAGVENKRLDLNVQEGLGLSSAAELQAALTGKPGPKHVLEMQHLIEESQFLIFVHPVFWFDVPSSLKGFLDSVFTAGFAFRKLPNHWALNRATGVIEHLPIVRTYLRRYASHGMLRDKCCFVTRTQGGPAAGLGVFGHGASSLESTLQFCGAHIGNVDTLAELDSTPDDVLTGSVLPEMERAIRLHCQTIAEHNKKLWRAPAKPSPKDYQAIHSEPAKSAAAMPSLQVPPRENSNSSSAAGSMRSRRSRKSFQQAKSENAESEHKAKGGTPDKVIESPPMLKQVSAGSQASKRRTEGASQELAAILDKRNQRIEEVSMPTVASELQEGQGLVNKTTHRTSRSEMQCLEAALQAREVDMVSREATESVASSCAMSRCQSFQTASRGNTFCDIDDVVKTMQADPLRDSLRRGSGSDLELKGSRTPSNLDEVSKGGANFLSQTPNCCVANERQGIALENIDLDLLWGN